MNYRVRRGKLLIILSAFHQGGRLAIRTCDAMSAFSYLSHGCEYLIYRGKVRSFDTQTYLQVYVYVTLCHGSLQVSQKKLLFTLFIDGIQFITKLKSNMKGQIMTIGDRILLRKRALIETINDELKNMAQIEHSRHRSVVGFTVNLMAGLAAYSFFPKKPMIDVERVSPYENGVIQLSLF